MTYELLVVKVGEVETARSKVYLNYHLFGAPDESISMNFYFWVARRGDEVILIDTGFSAEGARSRGRTPLIAARDALQHLGIAPEDVSTVVITHLHYDHAGNLGEFPRARVVIARQEVEFWESRHAQRRLFAIGSDQSDLDAISAARDEDRLTLFDETFDVAPGIDAIRVGGHTPGSVIVRVATDEGTVVLASDALHFYEELDTDYLFAVMTDTVAGYEACERLAQLRDEGAIVLPGHDVAVFENYPPADSGPLAGFVSIIGAQDSTGASRPDGNV